MWYADLADDRHPRPAHSSPFRRSRSSSPRSCHSLSPARPMRNSRHWRHGRRRSTRPSCAPSAPASPSTSPSIRAPRPCVASLMRKLAEGSTNDEIRQFFVERYGPSVLLEPPREGLNWLVWVVPPIRNPRRGHSHCIFVLRLGRPVRHHEMAGISGWRSQT